MDLAKLGIFAWKYMKWGSLGVLGGPREERRNLCSRTFRLLLSPLRIYMETRKRDGCLKMSEKAQDSAGQEQGRQWPQ